MSRSVLFEHHCCEGHGLPGCSHVFRHPAVGDGGQASQESFFFHLTSHRVVYTARNHFCSQLALGALGELPVTIKWKAAQTAVSRHNRLFEELSLAEQLRFRSEANVVKERKLQEHFAAIQKARAELQQYLDGAEDEVEPGIRLGV